ncbi:BspA family leucine-rich repeat surface protein [Bifidobacterium sp. ESL0769]|uniref:BspA family leucine-rich repeat surface protein n=1 Tax=Bifidobacterium sp. ESL0769 TaxID=2983229 RepID=UPI0023F9FE94|nr:BspA family leucine-rich repeat surface protein [Bifidobacterium sp. ESL0769]WEV67433.1 BspA family leucine-rich repeat surface protein [Bifidobacterium sp. ESL0769]
MHSHGNRTPPQNEPSVNQSNNLNPAASSQTVSATSAAVSASSTIQTHGSSASSSTTFSTSAPTGNVAGTSNTNANQHKNTQNSKRTTGKDAKTTHATGLTHTNAAATPTAKPKTLSALATKDFSDASKTLATFLQRMKKSTSHTANSRQTTPADTIDSQSSAIGTLPHDAATLTVKQSPVGPQTPSPLTREAPSVSTQDEPMVGPQSNNPRLTRLYADPNDDGHLQISGEADQVYSDNWVHVEICPVNVSVPVTGSGNYDGYFDNRCTNIETYTNGDIGGYRDGGTFHWDGNESRNDHTWTTQDSDFKTGPGYYNIWAYNRSYGWAQYQGNIIRSYYYCSHAPSTQATISYNMPAGWSTPASSRVDTSASDTSVILAGTPSGPSWAMFDGWTFNGRNYNAGATAQLPWRATGTYTVTPRYHALPTSVSMAYNMNGMDGTAPATQTIDTTNYAGTFTLASPPSHPSWQVFDGWSVDGGGTQAPGSSYAVAIHASGSHTATARWHVGNTYSTVTYNLNGGTGTAPGSRSVDTTYGAASVTLSDGTGVTPPTGKVLIGWDTSASGTGDRRALGATVTFVQGQHTTFALYAVYKDTVAPTGVTAWYSHADSRIYLDVTGLDPNATGWSVQVKPAGTGDWQYTSSTSTRGRSYYYTVSDFTPGATWQARAYAIYPGHLSSEWSASSSGILPYMDITLKPGDQQPGDTASAQAKGLVDQAERKGYVSLPAGVGTAPAGMAFQSSGGWTVRADGSGNSYNSGDTAIPTSMGVVGSDGTILLTLYARWKPTTQAPARGQPCASVTGWAQWGTSAGALSGVTGQDTGAVCWAVEGSTLRLTGGTSPVYQNNFPWNASKSAITDIHIEGNLTLAIANYSSTPFNYMPHLGHVDIAPEGKLRPAYNTAGDLFSNNPSLERLDASRFDMTAATTISSMFSYDTGLKEVTGLEHWDTSQIDDMSRIFQGDTSLENAAGTENWDTGHANNMIYVFKNCDSLVDLDLSHWKTSQLNNYGIAQIIPANLKRLRLGPDTKLASGSGYDDPFVNLDATHTWHEWDWPKGQHPSNLGLVGPNTTTRGDGTPATLRARAANNPAGVYIRSDVTPTWVDVAYDLAGGSGPAATFPTGIGPGTTPNAAIDTTFTDGTLTADPKAITANKAHSLFNGWALDTTEVTSAGKPTLNAGLVDAPKGAAGAIKLTAKWAALDSPAPTLSAPVVHAAAGATPTVDLKVGNPATYKTGGKLAITTNRWTAPVHTYTSDGTGGDASLTGQPVTVLQASCGQAYTIDAAYTDPDAADTATGNTVTPNPGHATQLAGTLPYATLTFDANNAYGGDGTPPAEIKRLIDTTDGKAHTTLPLPGNTMKPAHAAFTGWASTAMATSPDTGMGDPASRAITVTQHGTDTETPLTLYAVWKQPAAPTVTGMTRAATDNTVTITGTTVPQTATDTLSVAVTALDGQAGTSLGTPLTATIGDTSNSWDGLTAHHWTLTIPAAGLPQGGRYQIVATLATGEDGAWRGSPSPRTVTSPDTDPGPGLRVPGHHQHALPLTGGQRTMLIIALALLGVILTAGSQLARNRRRWHHQ